MGMAAAAWDVLAKAANLAQMSGLHAAMLVAVLTTLLRVQQRNKLACVRLERCTRRLHALLQWPATGCCGIALLLCSEMADTFGQALDDAAGLVDSYKKSTLWRRLWGGGSMATQLRDMQDVLESYCSLLLCSSTRISCCSSTQLIIPRRQILRFILRRVTRHQVQVPPRLPAKLKCAWMLQWLASGGVALLLPSSETGGPFREALADPARLVDSYKGSTLWRRLSSGGRMATQPREMQDVLDSYWGLLLFINAHLLLQQQAVQHHHNPPSPDSSTTIPEVNDDTSQSLSAEAVTSCPACSYRDS